MNEAFDQLTKSLDTLYGLPGVALTLLFCVGMGYFLKMVEFFPNKRIPIVVVIWGMLWNVLLRPAPPKDMMMWQHYCRLIAVGFLIGITSCLAYDRVLKRLENKWPWLRTLLGENGENKPEGPPP